MKRLFVLLTLISCQSGYEPPQITPEEITSIREVAKKNEGLSKIEITSKGNYKLTFNNDNFKHVGERLCPREDCFVLEESDYITCENNCSSNDGVKVLKLKNSCEEYQYLGAEGGYCGFRRYHFHCICKNGVISYRSKDVPRKTRL